MPEKTGRGPTRAPRECRDWHSCHRIAIGPLGSRKETSNDVLIVNASDHGAYADCKWCDQSIPAFSSIPSVLFFPWLRQPARTRRRPRVSRLEAAVADVAVEAAVVMRRLSQRTQLKET